MFKKPFILSTKAGAGNNTSKPKTLYRYEPITVILTPGIVMAGVIVILIMLSLSFGSIENYNLLLSGV